MEQKRSRETDIVLTVRAHDMCEQYMDIKEGVLDECLDEDPFFVNAKGELIAKMTGTKSSLMTTFSKVTGISNFTTNSVHRATEDTIQREPVLKQVVDSVQSHTAATGQKHYH